MNLKKELKSIAYVYSPDIGLALFGFVGGLFILAASMHVPVDFITYIGLGFMCVSVIILLGVVYRHVSYNRRVHGRTWSYS